MDIRIAVNGKGKYDVIVNGEVISKDNAHASTASKKLTKYLKGQGR